MKFSRGKKNYHFLDSQVSTGGSKLFIPFRFADFFRSKPENQLVLFVKHQRISGSALFVALLDVGGKKHGFIYQN